MEHRGVQMGFNKQHTKHGKLWKGIGLDLRTAMQTSNDHEFGTDNNDSPYP
jgi:hypothetical protein